jgi:hypothetical protein
MNFAALGALADLDRSRDDRVAEERASRFR